MPSPTPPAIILEPAVVDEFLVTVIANLGLPAAVIAPDARVLALNSRFDEAFGPIDPAHPALAVTPPDEAVARLRATVRLAVQTGTSTVVVLVDGAGASHRALVRSLRGERSAQVVAVVRDLSDFRAITFGRKGTREHLMASGLSGRSLDAVTAVLDGNSVAAVAATMNVSAETVRSHLKRAYRRFGVANRGELAEAIGRLGGSAIDAGSSASAGRTGAGNDPAAAQGRLAGLIGHGEPDRAVELAPADGQLVGQ
jgi:DNA-binding CsgD family transcriptional regulator